MRKAKIAPVDLGRRRLVRTLGFAVPALWLFGGTLDGRDRSYAQVATTQSAPKDFMALSRLLTGHEEIPDALADAAYSALVQRHADFPERFATLRQALADAGVTDFAEIAKAAPLQDAEMKKTAVALVSAWYLGRVGAVVTMSEDASTFITFSQALMWRPTIDVTVLPTYSRGGPGHWASPPKGVSPR